MFYIESKDEDSDICFCIYNKKLSAKQVALFNRFQDMFTGFNQNDLPEFLIFVIDCFHNSLSREVKMTIEGEIKDEKDKIALKYHA